jgi:hypothetical protein
MAYMIQYLLYLVTFQLICLEKRNLAFSPKPNMTASSEENGVSDVTRQSFVGLRHERM